ncbi:MAG TPA: hypothetical protein VK147_12205 [Candidatus Didemnitutus sp.]|nr:hypothetical protein [Candidatus Didemnitutus sp.]
MSRKINEVETLLFKDSTVQLTGRFGTVELEKSKLSTEIRGAVRPGFFGMRMYFGSDGQRYWLHLNEERLLDDKIVDMLNRKSAPTSTEGTTNQIVADRKRSQKHDDTYVYSRRIKELLLSLVMVVLGAWLVSFRYGMNENVKAIIISSALSTIAVLFVWTRGPLLRRIEIAESHCVIRYWSNNNLPKTVKTPLGNLAVRTIACKINGQDRVVDLLRADALMFFLVRNDGMLSRWSTPDAKALLNSGIVLI